MTKAQIKNHVNYDLSYLVEGILKHYNLPRLEIKPFEPLGEIVKQLKINSDFESLNKAQIQLHTGYISLKIFLKKYRFLLSKDCQEGFKYVMKKYKDLKDIVRMKKIFYDIDF